MGPQGGQGALKEWGNPKPLNLGASESDSPILAEHQWKTEFRDFCLKMSYSLKKAKPY